MKKPGINLSEVKERNRASVLRLLCTAPSITRSELSERLCLSPMTVTNITSELLGARLIEEVTPCSHAKTPGRTPMLLRIAPDSPVVAGVLLTKCNVFGILSDLSLHPLGRAHCTLDEGETEQSILKKIFSIVRQLLACTTRPCCGLGISSAGVVNPENSGIAYITDFFGVQSMELREPLEARFGFPVYVYNDMQAAGLCELYFGWGRQEESFLYVGVTNGAHLRRFRRSALQLRQQRLSGALRQHDRHPAPHRTGVQRAPRKPFAGGAACHARPHGVYHFL